jgi:hypothetical protein
VLRTPDFVVCDLDMALLRVTPVTLMSHLLCE